MKTEELIMLAVAGAVLLWAMKSRALVGAAVLPKDYSTEIANPSKPGDAAYGWQYFTGGTVIDPDGSYWKDGRIVWAPGLGF